MDPGRLFSRLARLPVTAWMGNFAVALGVVWALGHLLDLADVAGVDKPRLFGAVAVAAFTSTLIYHRFWRRHRPKTGDIFTFLTYGWFRIGKIVATEDDRLWIRLYSARLTMRPRQVRLRDLDAEERMQTTGLTEMTREQLRHCEPLVVWSGRRTEADENLEERETRARQFAAS